MECANLRADLDQMTALVHQMKRDVGKSIFNLSTEMQKTYDNVVQAVKRKIEENLVDG